MSLSPDSGGCISGSSGLCFEDYRDLRACFFDLFVSASLCLSVVLACIGGGLVCYRSSSPDRCSFF